MNLKDVQIKKRAFKANIISIINFSLLLILLTGSGCATKFEIQEHEELLKRYLETFHSDDHPVYFQTISQEKISNYLGDGFSLQHVFYLVDSPDSLKIIFNEKVISGLVENVRHYNSIPITEELAQGHRVIREEEIPDFVKDETNPPPFNYTGFTNVYFLSTPIISDNRAIIFVDTYGPTTVGITMYFFIRDSKQSDWKQIGGGSVHKISYYSN